MKKKTSRQVCKITFWQEKGMRLQFSLSHKGGQIAEAATVAPLIIYQDRFLAILPSITTVDGPSTMEHAALPRESLETRGSSQ
jgi:hypothetical protein